MIDSLNVRELTIGGGPIAWNEREVFQRFLKLFDIQGMRVLEIGGSLPNDLVSPARMWWSVDPRVKVDIVTGRRMVLRGFAESLPTVVSDVDLVFACNSFQHVGDLVACFREIRRVLKPDGAVYANFGPVWSAPDGAHFEDVRLKAGMYHFWHGAKIPAWSHLVLNAAELRELAVAVQGKHDGTILADYVRDSKWINRLSLRHHIEIPRNEGFMFERLSCASEFGYEFASPAPPPKFEAALTWSAVSQAAVERLGMTPDTLRIRDMEYVLRHL